MSQLSLIRQGGLAADIEQALSECVRQVCYLGKGGSVTIKISVKKWLTNLTDRALLWCRSNLRRFSQSCNFFSLI